MNAMPKKELSDKEQLDQEFLRYMKRQLIKERRIEEDAEAYVKSTLEIKKKGTLWIVKEKDGKFYAWDSNGQHTPSLVDKLT